MLAKRRIVTSTTLGAGVVLVIALFLIANYFGWKYHKRFDWTSTGLYTLSEKSKSVLEGLDRDIDIVVFMSPADELYSPVTELLARYEAASPHIEVREVDAEKNLLEAQRLVEQFELGGLNVVVFDAGDDRRVLEGFDLADYDYSGLQMGEGPQITSFKGEQLFTSTLLELVESRKPRVLFTRGHGELDLEDGSQQGLSAAKGLLGRDNFEIESWASLGATEVPDGVDLLVIAGPTSTFAVPEIDLLRAYLEERGRLLVLLDPTFGPTGEVLETGLEELLADYGVEVRGDLVVDPGSTVPFFGAETFYSDSYGSHEITRALDQARLPVIFPLARSVSATEPAQEGLRGTVLMSTTEEGWAETDLANLERVERGEADLLGPVPLAVAVEGGEAVAGDGSETGSRSFRLVVVGDSDFATNVQLQNVPNATLLANTLNWLVERETLLEIAPKAPEQVRLALTGRELTTITWLVLVVLPGSSLLLGAMVYWRRRR